jgi:hypothetical protein
MSATSRRGLLRPPVRPSTFIIPEKLNDLREEAAGVSNEWRAENASADFPEACWG